MIPPENKDIRTGSSKIDYKFLVENCADILCSMSTDRVILYVTPSSLDILGWQPEEMVGKPFDGFVFLEDLAALEVAVDATPPDFRLRLRLRRKDQTYTWISVNARSVQGPPADEMHQYVLTLRDITDRKVLEEKLSALAMTDNLTGLWNRRAFDEALIREWRRTIREESQISLLLLDLDHFKLLNDRYGHALGDECLTAVASAITDTVRTSDIVCRWGGDEVAIILPSTGADGATRAAEKVRKAVENLRLRAGVDEAVSVTASIGVAAAIFQPWGTMRTPQELLRAADKALYIAKREGQNRVAIVGAHISEPSEEGNESSQIESDGQADSA